MKDMKDGIQYSLINTFGSNQMYFLYESYIFILHNSFLLFLKTAHFVFLNGSSTRESEKKTKQLNFLKNIPNFAPTNQLCYSWL